MTLLYWALGLFVLGALGGLVMAANIFGGKKPPVALAVGHGVLGATGLVLLLIAAVSGAAVGMAKIALGILVVAALGGFYLVSFHIRKQEHPRAVVVVHALIAATGVVLLLWTILQPSGMA